MSLVFGRLVKYGSLGKRSTDRRHGLVGQVYSGNSIKDDFIDLDLRATCAHT